MTVCLHISSHELKDIKTKPIIKTLDELFLSYLIRLVTNTHVYDIGHKKGKRLWV